MHYKFLQIAFKSFCMAQHSNGQHVSFGKLDINEYSTRFDNRLFASHYIHIRLHKIL